jgi:hypothetical protein
VIIFPILNVVSTHHFDLSEVGILLPLMKTGSGSKLQG